MLFERCHTKNRKKSIKQHIQYFKSYVLLDHPLQGVRQRRPGTRLGRFRQLLPREVSGSDLSRVQLNLEIKSNSNNFVRLGSIVCLKSANDVVPRTVCRQRERQNRPRNRKEKIPVDMMDGILANRNRWHQRPKVSEICRARDITRGLS